MREENTHCRTSQRQRNSLKVPASWPYCTSTRLSPRVTWSFQLLCAEGTDVPRNANVNPEVYREGFQPKPPNPTPSWTAFQSQIKTHTPLKKGKKRNAPKKTKKQHSPWSKQATCHSALPLGEAEALQHTSRQKLQRQKPWKKRWRRHVYKMYVLYFDGFTKGTKANDQVEKA